MSQNQKSLLICIQAVDLDDPLLGFFITWLKEASKQFSSITVLALRVGRYDSLPNLTVVPLRPEGLRTSRFAVAVRFFKEVWQRRHAYDAVFVRGDPHYVLLAGWLWRCLGKTILFWYAHYRVSRLAVLAGFVAHVLVTSMKAAYPSRYGSPITIGQSIDQTRFNPAFRESTNDTLLRCLVLGRIMPSKRIELILKGYLLARTSIQASLTLVGPPVDEVYKRQISEQMVQDSSIQWGGSISYDALPSALHEYDVLINMTSGSLDKVIVEAAMSGLITLAATDAMREWLPEELSWLSVKTEYELKSALERVYGLPLEERRALGMRLAELATQQHSIEHQIRRLAELAQRR